MMYSRLLRTAVRLIIPLILLFSVFMLLRGHSAPGGGFVGGLSAAAAVALYILAQGAEEARAQFPVSPTDLAATGLLIAGLAGLAPLLEGRPFLTALWWNIPLPGGGYYALGTPFFFDVGVYLAVLGTVVNIIFSLELRVRRPEEGR